LKILYSKLWSNKVIIFGLLVIYFLILIYLSKVVSPWEDEFYTLNTTSRNLSQVISQSYHFEAQPPLYFVILKFWRQINDGVFFARLLSVFFIGLSAYFFHRLINLISGKESSKWLLIIFLLNPFTVWAAIEMRSYAMIILISIISVYFFLKFHISNEKKFIHYFLIFATIGLYTQYLFVFLIISLLLSLLVLRGWKPFFKLCTYLVPVAILFLPNFLFIYDDIAIQQTDNPFITWKSTLFMVLQTPPTLILGLNRVPFGGFWKLIITMFSIFLASFAYMQSYKQRRGLDDFYLEKINLILITILVFVCLYILAFIIFKIQYADLYMAIIFPILILIIIIFNDIPNLYRKLLFAALSLYFIFILLFVYKNPVKFYDFNLAAQYVSEIERYSEPILFYRNEMSLPFSYYYKGHNPIIPFPRPVSFDTTFHNNIKDTLELKLAITKINTKSNSYILISDEKTGYAYSVNYNRKMVNDYLNSHYITTLDTLFFGKAPVYYLRIRRIENIQNQ
jgi:uncharacterized membrane protein